MLLTTIPAMLIAASAPAQAADTTSGPASLIGNTIEVRYGGELMVTSLAADGTFKMKTPDGKPASGDWVADNRYVCWITKVPAFPAGQNFRCETIVPGKKVGDTWTQTDIYGHEAKITLLAGDRLTAK